MIPEAWNCGQLPAGARIVITANTKTGWPPGMLQDDDRKLSIWLANRIDSRRHAREAAEEAGRASIKGEGGDV